MNTKKIQGAKFLSTSRRRAAVNLIETAGGPAELARQLTIAMGVRVTPGRVTKWALIGVPAAWGPILEKTVPGVRREDLNPWLYTDYEQVIHNKGIEYLVSV